MTRLEKILTGISTVSILASASLCVITYQQQNYIQSLSSQLSSMQDERDTFIKKQFKPLKHDVETLDFDVDELRGRIDGVESDVEDAHSRIDYVQDDANQALNDANGNSLDLGTLRDELNRTHRHNYYY